MFWLSAAHQTKLVEWFSVLCWIKLIDKLNNKVVRHFVTPNQYTVILQKYSSLRLTTRKKRVAPEQQVEITFHKNDLSFHID